MDEIIEEVVGGQILAITGDELKDNIMSLITVIHLISCWMPLTLLPKVVHLSPHLLLIRGQGTISALNPSVSP